MKQSWQTGDLAIMRPKPGGATILGHECYSLDLS